MSTSTCPKCTNSSIEVINKRPHNQNFKLLFVQCGQCGSDLGTIDNQQATESWPAINSTGSSSFFQTDTFGSNSESVMTYSNFTLPN